MIASHTKKMSGYQNLSFNNGKLYLDPKKLKMGSFNVLDEVLSIYEELILEKVQKGLISADRQTLHRLSNIFFYCFRRSR